MLKTPISILQELSVQKKLPPPNYETSGSGPSHTMSFVCNVKLGNEKTIGRGSSKKDAKHSAASKMLAIFGVTTNQTNSLKMVKFLGQKEAINIVEDLFNEYKYSVDQLMELAGLSCAIAVTKCFPRATIGCKSILICCGPGNNGGDGLVCARHLKLFQYNPVVYYPKQTIKELYQNLTHQCLSMNIPVVKALPETSEIETGYGLIIDALFGFSFKPPVRTDFVPVIDLMKSTSVPIASVDIPSGWNVENGESEEEGGIKPELLISLIAPKKCALQFQGKYHYLGGRFVPPKLAEKYELELPQYPDTECCVALK